MFFPVKEGKIDPSDSEGQKVHKSLSDGEFWCESMGCALGCAKLLPGAALLLGERKQSWQRGRSLKAQVLNSSSVKAFNAPERPARRRCIQWPVLFRQWKMSWKLQLFFPFGSDNIPSWPEIVLMAVQTKRLTLVLLSDVCWNPLCGSFPG